MARTYFHSHKPVRAIGILLHSFFLLRIDFILAIIEDYDEMPRSVAFHLGIHCMPKYAFSNHFYTKGLSLKIDEARIKLFVKVLKLNRD